MIETATEEGEIPTMILKFIFSENLSFSKHKLFYKISNGDRSEKGQLLILLTGKEVKLWKQKESVKAYPSYRLFKLQNLVLQKIFNTFMK